VDDILEYLMSNPPNENKDPLGGGRLWNYNGKHHILSHPGADHKLFLKYMGYEKKMFQNTMKNVSPAFLKAFELFGKLIVVLIKLKGLEEAKLAELAMFHFNTFLENNLLPKEVETMYNLHSHGPTVRDIMDKEDECLHIKGFDLQHTYNLIYRKLNPPFPSIFHKDMTREDAFRYLKDLETAAASVWSV
jgi:hypothetical protein